MRGVWDDAYARCCGDAELSAGAGGACTVVGVFLTGTASLIHPLGFTSCGALSIRRIISGLSLRTMPPLLLVSLDLDVARDPPSRTAFCARAESQVRRRARTG